MPGHHTHFDCALFVVQFSLLNGSIHDSWLQQGHEGMTLDDKIRAKCEVLACQKPPATEPNRKKADKASEVHTPLKLCFPPASYSNAGVTCFKCQERAGEVGGGQEGIQRGENGDGG